MIITDTKYVADLLQLSARGMLTGTATRVLGGNAGVQPYKYGTKELDRQNGLDWYDADGERDKRTVPVSHLQPSKFYRSSISRYSSDEVLAYRAQFAFSKQGFPIFGIVKMTDISAEKVAAIVSADGIPVYQILYDYLTK